MSLQISSRFRFSHILKITNNFHKRLTLSSNRSCNSGVQEKKIEDYFLEKKVQSILKKITGLNYDQIFQPRKEEIIPDQYEFVTENQLKEMFEASKVKAELKLQMPPVMAVREPIDEILSKDPELQYYLETKLVFIDTSPSKTDRNRVITVRETDGTLRKGNWDERFKMNQIFFPLEGRSLETPKLFESPYLDKLLEDESYEFILDAACAQFEPDDPEYHRVTKSTYEHIKSRKKFDVLRCTRHFGPMAFYCATSKDITPLLIDMLEKQLISDAADTIRLLHILHPDVETSSTEMDDIEYIKDFVERHKSSKTADLELALQTLLEVQSNIEVKNSSS